MVRCEFCKNKIKKKKEPFVKKYYNFTIEYFHAWCWELKKTSTLYNEWQYSNIDPRLKNQMIIELAKQAYLNTHKKELENAQEAHKRKNTL
ncbi:MAG: hypothetical protein ACFFG0_04820 [Candidatus Thorarchaeota archaeon]